MPSRRSSDRNEKSSDKQQKQRTSRWGRRLSQNRSNSQNPPPEGAYVPPTLDQPDNNDKESNRMSGISTLFRRDGSEESHGVHVSASSESAAIAGPGKLRRPPSRLFYSEDVSSDDDSYESRISTARSTQENNDADDENDPSELIGNLIRYRGFSTSIKSLFLDEALVCASMGCFGLLLSHRTEHLLQVRNFRRGDKDTGGFANNSKPSNVMAYSLLIMWLLIAATFVVWGFGSGTNKSESEEDLDGYGGDDIQEQQDDDGQNENVDDKNNDDQNYGNRRVASVGVSSRRYHKWHGICRLRDSQERVWEPLMDFIHEEWSREDDQTQRQLDQSGYDGYDNIIQEGNNSNIGTTIRSGLVLFFLVILGIVGRKRRMRTRYAVVRARAQEDYLFHASSLSRKQTVREDQYEGACSHTLCGCYPVDPPTDENSRQEQNDDLLALQNDSSSAISSLFGKTRRRHEDCVSRGFNCLLASCCGVLCKCWFQCLSICALAQEGREARVLVPPRDQRIDYITLQPFSEYQKSVNDLRRGWLGKTRRKVGFKTHWLALSRLSRYILIAFASTFAVIVLTLVFNPRASFSWNDAIILIATFVQSFLVLYFVHWIFHKSDLSLDAVVKFFAAGFLIAIPTAFIFEGLLVNVILATVYSLYSITEIIFGEKFVDFVVSHYRFLWILGELVNAYIVAAVTEELCKYYTFRAVEHPDLIFLTGLDRAAQDKSAIHGGVIKYPYGGHQVSNLNRSNSFGSEYSHRSSRSSSRKKTLVDPYGINRTTTEEAFFEDENDIRTYRQKAMAVTTGMISVAVGLACAENFLYVFILGGSNSSASDDTSGGVILEEWMVLFFRSIFPIHALSAAMQSINMIRKFVECSDHNSHRIGVGRIIVPAVILHGTFDAVLLSINVYVESAWDKYMEENNGDMGAGQPYNPLVVNLVAWLSIIFIMTVGIVWYYRQNRTQRLRLILMDERDRAADGLYPSAKDPPREVELV